MANEKKQSSGGTQSSAAKNAGAEAKPGQGNKSDANRKPDHKGKASEQTKR